MAAKSPEVLRFLRVAAERLEDPKVLVANKRGTGAIYLAGYSVECGLKALLLGHVPPGQRRALVKPFRGTKAHDYEWLQTQLRKRKFLLPPGVVPHLATVNTWSTDLRYEHRLRASEESDAFLHAAGEILAWVQRTVG